MQRCPNEHVGRLPLTTLFLLVILIFKKLLNLRNALWRCIGRNDVEIGQDARAYAFDEDVLALRAHLDLPPYQLFPRIFLLGLVPFWWACSPS